MSNRISKRSLVAMLVGASLALPTAAAGDPGLGNGNSGSQDNGANLRRDGSKVAAFVAYPTGTELRRDGSRAAPFVTGPDAAPLPAADGFDWADATVGAGAAMGLVALGGAGLVLRRRVASEGSSVGQPKPRSA
jgi:hypothetical protein